MERLQAEGIACAAIDITAIGTWDITPEQWYAGVIDSIVGSLYLYNNFDLDSWWESHHLLSPVQRFGKFIEDVLLVEISGQIVIFVDEIDSILSLSFSIDDFFALIRSCYNLRADNPEYKRITFTLFGVATPSDLIADKKRTPFNIGRAIALTGFQFDEAAPLAEGFVGQVSNPQAVLREILTWTGGQPFLTQKVCKLLLQADRPNPPTPFPAREGGVVLPSPSRGGVGGEVSINAVEWVEELVRSHVIRNWESQDEPEHLRTIRDRLLQNQQRAGRLLGLYQQILQSYQPPFEKGGEGGIASDDSSEQMELRLSGLVVKQQGLKVSNRIYAAVFNQSWVDQAFAKLRPYAQGLTAWLDSGCEDESRLLRGQTLRDAQTWTVGKSLSDQDYQFLAASQQLDRQEVQIALDAERQAKQILADARQKAEIALEEERQANQRLAQAQQKTRRQTYIGAAILGVTLLGAVVIATVAEQARQNAFTAGEVEREGNSASERFKLNKAESVQSLVMAMQAGQTLKNLVKEKPSIVDYPALSPILSIQEILAEIQEKNTLEGHSLPVLSVAFSSDGKTIASGSYDNTIKIWDSSTGKVIRTLTGHSEFVRSVAFSSDGKTIASGSYDNTIKIWDSSTGKVIRTLTGHSSPVYSVAFSSDGKTIASGSYDNTIKIWDSSTGKLIRTLTGHSSPVYSVAFSSDGKTIASGSEDKTIKIWDSSTGKVIRTLTGHSSDTLSFSINNGKTVSFGSSVAFSSDGKTIASGSDDNTIKIWDSSTGKLIRTLTGHSSSVLSVAFSSDGKTVASGSWDNTIKIWDSSTGKLIRTLTGHSQGVLSVAFSSDGKIASGSEDNTIKIWDSSTGKVIPTLKGHSESVSSVAFSSDGKTVASGSYDSTIKIWDSSTGKLIRTLTGHSQGVLSVAFSSDGKTVASGSWDNTIKIWDSSTGKLIRTLTGYSQGVLSVAFSSDGKIASGSEDNTIKIWDSSTGKVIPTLKGHSSIVSSVAFSSDGKTVASGSADNTIKIWDSSTGKLIRTLTGHSSSVNSVAFSSDGKTVASGSDDNSIKIWDSSTGKLIRTLTGHSSSVNSVAFSSDGKTVASGSADNTIKIWDSSTGKLIRTLTGHSESVSSVAFSSDGKTVASGSYDNTIKIWYFDLDNLLSRSCQRLKAYLINHPEDLEPLTFCQEQNPDILLAAVPVMVTAGETSARNGNFEDALAKFKTAKKWDSKLDINPKVKTDSLRLEFEGRKLANEGDFDGAITKFKQAKQLNVKIDFDTVTDGVQNDPEKVAKELVSQVLVKQGREQANKGDVDGATAKLKQAQQLNAKIDLDDNTEGVQTNPQAVAKKLFSQALVQQGKDLATQGNLDGAVAKFKQAQKLDTKIDLDTDTKGVQTNIQAVAKDFTIKGLVDQGTQLARQGDIPDAVAKFKEAQRIQPKVDINPDIDGLQNKLEKAAQDLYIAGLIDEAEEQLKQDEYSKAIAVYKKIENLKPTKENLAKSGNSLCRQASLQGYVKNVVNDACEKAVKLAPNNAYIRDSRGLARALTGNFKGAIEDFQVFIESTDDGDEKKQRESWVKDLQAGKNPFTPEELEKLRGD
jgi:WD40 repeat protein